MSEKELIEVNEAFIKNMLKPLDKEEKAEHLKNITASKDVMLKKKMEIFNLGVKMKIIDKKDKELLTHNDAIEYLNTVVYHHKIQKSENEKAVLITNNQYLMKHKDYLNEKYKHVIIAQLEDVNKMLEEEITGEKPDTSYIG